MSRKNLKSAAIALTLLASAAGALGQGFLDNFSSSLTLGNYNVYINSTTPTWGPAFLVTNSPYKWVATGGLNNGGAIAPQPTSSSITVDSTLIYHNASFDFSGVGTALNISAEFNLAAVSVGGNKLLQLGFLNASTNGMNGNSGIAFTSLRLTTVGTSGDTFTPQWQTKLASGSTVTPSLTPNVTLTAGDWYELSGTFVNMGGGNIQASGFLQDEGKNGATPGAVVFTFPTTTLTGIADITSDTAVWAGLRGFNGDGLNLVGDFGASIVPEPGPAALLALAVAVFLVTRRRKA
jgi:hypothetical protein